MKRLIYILLFVPFALFGQPPQVGDLGYGGILFYLDDDTEIAYDAALTNITEGAIYSTDGYYGYKWGCYQQEVKLEKASQMAFNF